MAGIIAIALDLVLVAVIVQGTWLSLHWRRTGRGIPPASLAATLAAGWFLLLALRLALGAAWPGWIGLALLGGLIAHLADLRIRWR